MELQQLRNFSVVSKVGSITKAAEILYVSQPNLSMSIKRLESDVGVLLFDRSKGKIRLTPMGEIFLEYVDDVLTRLDKGVEKVRSFNSQPTKMLSIAATGCSWLQPFCVEFSKHHPNQAFRTIVCPADDLIPAILRGETDFAVGPKEDFEMDIGWFMVYRERLGILVSKYHPIASQPSVSLQELRQETFVLNTSEYPRNYVMSVCRQADFSPKIVYECNDSKTLGSLVEENIGITFIDVNKEHSFYINLPDSTTRIVPLKENITRDIGVLHLKNSDLPISSQEIVNYYAKYYSRASTMPHE